MDFDEYFGFKADEAEEMCHYYDMDDKFQTVQDWYDGYIFGQTDIYNPWSVIKYIHEDITYDEIYDEGDNLWNFMFFTGYFRRREWMVGTAIYAELAIPNKEVRYNF